MKKSINLWSFPGDVSIENAMQIAADAGFAAVEPNLAQDGPLSLASTDAQIKQIKQMATDHGLELAALSSGLYWDAPPTHDDPAVRERALGIIKRQLEAAALLGVDTILVVPGLVGADFIPGAPVIPYDVAYERAQQVIASAEPHAKACGVAIGIENVWNKFLLSPLEMRSFIDSFGSDYVKAYFDVGNVILTGYPEHWIRILGKRIARVHVKDFRVSVGNINGFVDLLAGDVNYPEVVRALHEVGYDQYLTAEMGAYANYGTQIIYNTSAALERIINMK